MYNLSYPIKIACLLMIAASVSACAPPTKKTIVYVKAPSTANTVEKPQRTQAELYEREVKRRLSAGQSVSPEDIRPLADSGDGFAALRLAQSLEQSGASASDVAHYYAIAAAAGKGGATYGLVRQLRRPGIENAGKDRLTWIEQTTNGLARKGDPVAAAFMAEAYRSGKPFGENRDKSLSLQTQLAEGGNANAALDAITTLLSEPDPSREELEQALSLIDVALENGNLSTKTTAQNLRPRVVAALSEEPVEG
ncbi:hypothetical protein [Litoreibacter roseus]|uniref:Sel1 repeat family protein n=1 Tax=Litoreibacter roseus TaxID=2601869 RepID=A0A6N6JAD5_9RHOB|nr:hypothetical protein [Litoreibacter roseus]GFE63203.1 hypothetical protein KIN_02770 [Litoreibacter roseus]